MTTNPCIATIFRLSQNPDPSPNKRHRLEPCDEACSKPRLIRWLIKEIAIILSLVQETHGITCDDPPCEEHKVDGEACDPDQRRADSCTGTMPKVEI